MRLVSIDDRAAGSGSAGAILASGDIVHLGRIASPGTVEAWLPDTLLGILQAGPDGLAVVRGMVERADALRGDAAAAARLAGHLLAPTTRLQAPIGRPAMVLAAGLAFKSHLAEMAGTPVPPHPTAFLKTAASVAGPGPVRLPPDASEQVDYEGELAVVFGSHCHGVTAAEALGHVAGYTAANDLSARDWVRDVWAAERPWDARRTWEINIMGKQFPGFTALGPALTTTDEIPDPSALRLRTTLNGEMMQDASMDDMIFPLADVIAWFSRWHSFAPGDVLLTGTPAGVGVGRSPQRFVRPGDRVVVEIERIGALVTDAHL